MSDINSKLLERLASMESELATLRRPAPQTQSAPQFDPADPIGSLKRMGADTTYLTKLLVADAMGDQAPPEFRALAAMGPQISATRALDAKLEQLSRQVSTIVESSTKSTARSSFQKLTADKSKYPALSKALAADPDFFNEDLEAHRGSAEEFATRAEAKLVKLGYYTPPTESEENSETTDDGYIVETPELSEADQFKAYMNDDSIVANGQSQQATPAVVADPPPRRQASAPGRGNPPPVAKAPVGLWTEADHARTRDEVVRKFSGRPAQ